MFGHKSDVQHCNQSCLIPTLKLFLSSKTLKTLELQAFGQKNKSDSFNTNGIKIIRLIWRRV